MRVVFAIVVVLLATGCGGSHRSAPPTAREWKAVLRDYSDGNGVNRPHSCAAVRAAVGHLPDMIYVDRTLGGATRRYCG
jgi:hypothetical protein